MVWSLEFSAPSSIFWEGAWSWRPSKWSTRTLWWSLHKSAKSTRFRGPRWFNTPICWESGTLQLHRESSSGLQTFPDLVPCISSSDCSFISFNSLCKGRGQGHLWLRASWSEAQVTTWTCNVETGSEVGLGDSLVWSALTPERQCQIWIELYNRVSIRVGELLSMVVGGKERGPTHDIRVLWLWVKTNHRVFFLNKVGDHSPVTRWQLLLASQS